MISPPPLFYEVLTDRPLPVASTNILKYKSAIYHNRLIIHSWGLKISQIIDQPHFSKQTFPVNRSIQMLRILAPKYAKISAN